MVRRPAPASRPYGRCAVALRTSLDPDASSARPTTGGEDRKRTEAQVAMAVDVTTATDKQGSTSVRWAAVESVQRLPKTTHLGAFRDQVASRRGRNIGIVAAARRQVEFVYYALRDHHVRALGRSFHAR
jgi:hypothetical protein